MKFSNLTIENLNALREQVAFHERQLAPLIEEKFSKYINLKADTYRSKNVEFVYSAQYIEDKSTFLFNLSLRNKSTGFVDSLTVEGLSGLTYKEMESKFGSLIQNFMTNHID